MTKPLVSVFTPAYNCAQYIDATIKSVLAQTYTNFEYIIVDDCSTDNTLDVIKSYDDPRIVIVQNSENKGISFNRNIGVEQAKGTYIVMIDSDDLMHPERIQQQVEFMESNTDYGIIGTEIIRIDADQQQIGDVIKYPLPHDQIPSKMLFCNYIATSSTMIRMVCFEGIRFKESFIVAEDYEVWIQIIRKYKIGHISAPLTSYRTHEGSISLQKEQLMLDTDHLILKIQLGELQFEPSEDEYQLMFDIGKNKFGERIQEFSLITRTFNKIIESNKKSGLFNPAALRAFLFGYWREAFINVTTFDQTLFSEIKASPFHNLLSFSEKSKLAAKCVIGFKNK